MRAFALNSVSVTIMNASVHVANYVVFAGIAAFFGVSWQTDAFFLALTFPVFFVGAIVSAVSSVFIPIFAECKINRPHVLGQLIGSALLYVLAGTLLIVVLLGLSALYMFRWVMFDGIAPNFQRLVIQQTLLLLPVIVIQTLTGVISAFYNANGRFLYPPITDTISTLAILMIVAISKSAIGIFSIPLGFVFGALLHLILLSLFWSRFNVQIDWTWKVEHELRRSLGLSLPLILGTATLQLSTVITRFLAAQLPEGSITILDYASRISYGVVEFLTSGVLLVILAKWSQISAENDTARLGREVQNFTLIISFVIIPVIAIGIILRHSLVAIAFQRGSFDPAMTAATASVLFFFLLGIPIDAISRIYVRLFLVWQKTWIIGTLAGIRVIITTITAFTLMHFMGLVGIALADTIAILLIALALIHFANRKLGNTFSGSGVSFLKIGVSAICGGGTAALLRQMLIGKEFLELLIAGAVGTVIYIVISWALRNDQLKILLGLLRPHSFKGFLYE
jgi:putative peptidoglycan lipid II flippase